MYRYVTERGWLTVYQLPPHAPGLNPAEGLWSVLRRTTTGQQRVLRPRRPDHRHPVRPTPAPVPP
ncbi:hypothetical protein [Streptomyces physcomitrii]|uniref:hypothetical protein n=1 Tax=Streptomyces physcomitrii TaxID=2724184 RepID=UPI00406BAD13